MCLYFRSSSLNFWLLHKYKMAYIGCGKSQLTIAGQWTKLLKSLSELWRSLNVTSYLISVYVCLDLFFFGQFGHSGDCEVKLPSVLLFYLLLYICVYNHFVIIHNCKLFLDPRDLFLFKWWQFNWCYCCIRTTVSWSPFWYVWNVERKSVYRETTKFRTFKRANRGSF